MKTFIIGTSGTTRELPSFTSTNELLAAILSVQQTEDINGLYEDKKFTEIIYLCTKNPKLIYIEDATKTTLLGRACQDGHADLVRQFLEIPGIDISKGKINFINEEWNLSGFDIAIQNCQKEIIKPFLLHGYKFEYNSDGERILKTGGILKEWLNKGTSLDDQLNKIGTALDEAVKDVDAISDKVGICINTKDIAALFDMADNEPDLFTWIISEKPEYLNVKNLMGQNLLHYAARKGMIELVEKLLKSGIFDPNTLDSKGFSVVDYALWENHKEVTKVLVECGATYSKLVEFYQFYIRVGNKQKSQKFEEKAKLFLSITEDFKTNNNVDIDETNEIIIDSSNNSIDQEETVLSGSISYDDNI